MIKENNVKQIEYLRHLQPYQRIKVAFELYDFARSRISGELKRNHPELNNKELLSKLNERFTE
jgi:hypothetical protein